MHRTKEFAFARRLSILPIVAALLANSAVCLDAETPRATVVVDNRSRLLRHTVRDAEKIVDRIFIKAGVRLMWRPPLPAGVPDSSDGRPLRIIIISEEAALIIGYQRDSVAFTPGANRGTVSLAYVLAHRISAVSRGYGVAPWIVLGSAMAHEIGHMLLSGRHSQQGVMRASFNQADFRRIAAGDLAFTDSEAAGIRARMSIRDAYVHTTGLCERPLFMRAVDCPTTPAFTGLPHAGLR